MKKLRKWLALCLCAAAVIAAFAGCSKTAESTPVDINDFRVTSYITADSIADPAALCEADFDIVTDVILFSCATFDETGALQVQTQMMETALENLQPILASRDIPVYLNVLGPDPDGTFDDWNEQMAAKGELHKQAFESGVLEDNIMSIVNQYNFDGVYFDYEFPIEEEYWDAYNAFLVRMNNKLGDKLLGIALPDWDINLSDEAIAAVDRVEAMLYDIYDDDGRHATYELCTELSEKFAKAGIDKAKVDFGLPFYARPTDNGAYWYAWRDYCDLAAGDGAYTDEAIGKTFYFNTPDIVTQKTNYAIENGFGGMMVWNYSYDLPSTDDRSLLRAVGIAITDAKNAQAQTVSQ